MTEITLEWLDELIVLSDNDRAQFDMIKDLSRGELEIVIAMLLGVIKVKREIIHIVNKEMSKP